MKLRLAILLFIMALLALWALNQPRPPAEYERRERQRELARMDFERSYTNAVIGYRRTLNTFIFDSEDHYSKWEANAEVEFINARGGVERTNVWFRFRVDSGFDGRDDVQCHFDWKRQLDERAAVEKVQAGYKAFDACLDARVKLFEMYQKMGMKPTTLEPCGHTPRH